MFEIYRDYFIGREEDIKITGVLIWYYYICKRQVWFISRNIIPDQENELIELGKTIHELYYNKKYVKEFLVENVKVDLIKIEEDNQIIVGEIKKSSSFVKSATMQLSFYLLILRKYIPNLKAKIHIPLERKSVNIELTKELENELEECIKNIKNIVQNDFPPSLKESKSKYCFKCAYYNFCYS